MALKKYIETDWEVKDGRFWTNFLNTLSGFRSSVLIGTSNSEGHHNLGIFNSLVHLGANPPLLGFIMRPTTVTRDTYNNLSTSKFYTINHISESMLDAAHQTSASYASDQSEFDAVGFTPEYSELRKAPFVKESPVKLLLEYQEEHLIMNDTRLIVGAVKEVRLNDELLEEDGSIKMAEEHLIVSNGLYHYHNIKFLKKKDYARP